ncbi:cyclic-phosphate processing receiver domain-containing protein [Paenibacillus sp. y28]|uniref:cyclic-phosphate processing receiver domain-containing protein n=1 Tax=Paenibacillus sp. y28 TaxID=3129110 RepID=UPI00301B3F7B
MINVFMDDLRPCPDGFTLARTVEECLLLLRECEVNVLSLDHDMGWGQPNGTDLAAAIVREALFPREVYLHSSSEIGRRRMFELLYSAKPAAMILHRHALWEEKRT